MSNPRPLSSALLLALSSIAALSIAPIAVSAQQSPEVPAAAPQPKSMQELLDASTASDWRTLDPADTLYMDLASGRVVIELAPGFAPAHVANIRTLAHEHYWDGLSIYRSQDNFVVQFGDPTEDEQARKPIGSAKSHLPAEFTRSSAGPRKSASRPASRPRATRSRAKPGWRTATAPSAPAAMSPPTPATAPNCMSSTASRRASSTATSPWSAASCRGWNC